jgi:CubicO group peptidase (beta-lactamase class C family)
LPKVKLFIGIFFFLLQVILCNIQTFPINMAVNQERAQSFKDWIQAWVESEAIPGFAVGIYNEKNEEIFGHTSSIGNAYRKDSIFRIYSMTKPVTSVGILILLDKGLISLEDEVSKFIPSFANLQVITGGTPENLTLEPLKTPLKIIHLLTQTSGITYGIFGQTLADKVLLANLGPDVANLMHFTLLEDLCEMISKSHLAFQPGTQYQYGFNVDVLGRVIEVASGMNLEDFFQKEIFQPLSMVDTAFRLPPEKLSRLVDIYDPAPGMSLQINKTPEIDRSSNRVFISGGGGLVSTVSDYSKFANCLLNKGKILVNGQEKGNRLLKEETVDLMTKNHLPHNSQILDLGYDKQFLSFIHTDGYGFGLGVSVLQDKAKVKGGSLTSVGEYGWTGLAGTIWFNDPVRKISIILFSQLLKGSETYPIKQQVKWFSRYILEEGNNNK